MLTRRADFVAANRGLRVARPGFVLLAHPNGGLGKRLRGMVAFESVEALVEQMNADVRRAREILGA